jgi:hypothetical protein
MATFPFGTSVTAQIEARRSISAIFPILAEVIIPAAVLTHAVDERDYSFGLIRKMSDPGIQTQPI